MITKLITLAIIGVACGLLQRSAINRDEEIKDDTNPRKVTIADNIKDAFTTVSVFISAGAATNFLVTFGMIALSVLVSPLTIPALIVSAVARAAYINIARLLMVSAVFLLGNTLGHKLDMRKESI